MTKAIMVDVDDVILKWLDGFCDFMERCGHVPKTRTPAEWRFAEGMFPDLNPTYVYEQISVFNRSPDYLVLDEYEGSISGLLALRAGCDWPIVAVSAPGLHPDTVRMRAEHLYALPIDKLHLVDLGQSKGDVFKLYDKGSILIEDNAKNALEAAEHGHYAILVNRSHNVGIDIDHPLVFRVDGWEGITEAVLSLVEPEIEEAA